MTELYLTQKPHQMRAPLSVTAPNLCNLRGIIRLVTYIATTGTLVNEMTSAAGRC